MRRAIVGLGLQLGFLLTCTARPAVAQVPLSVSILHCTPRIPAIEETFTEIAGFGTPEETRVTFSGASCIDIGVFGRFLVYFSGHWPDFGFVLCQGCSRIVTIRFSRPVADIAIVLNAETTLNPTTVVLTTDTSSKTVALDRAPSPPNLVGIGGPTTSLTVFPLQDQWAYSIFGLSFVLASETPPEPSITSIEPNKGRQGQTLDVKVVGSNFDPNAELSFAPDGIAVVSYLSRQASEIRAQIRIENGSTVGKRDVVVRNPGGREASLPDGFDVVPGRSNVAFLPGIKGSRLYRADASSPSGELELWIPRSNQAMCELRPRSDGSSETQET